MVNRYRRVRARYRRAKRILFPSPAEVLLIRLLGGKAIVIDHIRGNRTKKNPAGFPLTFITTMGNLLGSENVRREVRCGKYWIDFGNDIRRGIEVDGEDYHQDVVYEQERSDFLRKQGWLIFRIPGHRLYREPDRVAQDVIVFLRH
jgi:very-short-patch-repair endonuclease